LEKQEVSKEIPIPEYPAFHVVTQKLKLENDYSVLMVSLDELLSYSKEYDFNFNLFKGILLKNLLNFLYLQRISMSCFKLCLGM
jgi:hypothetical protein